MSDQAKWISTGCKLPQAVQQLTFDYEHVGVGFIRAGALSSLNFSKALVGIWLE